jgi:hypothetical protein
MDLLRAAILAVSPFRREPARERDPSGLPGTRSGYVIGAERREKQARDQKKKDNGFAGSSDLR